MVVWGLHVWVWRVQWALPELGLTQLLAAPWNHQTAHQFHSAAVRRSSFTTTWTRRPMLHATLTCIWHAGACCVQFAVPACITSFIICQHAAKYYFSILDFAVRGAGTAERSCIRASALHRCMQYHFLLTWPSAIDYARFELGDGICI